MKRIDSTITMLVLVMISLCGTVARAEVTSALDRNRVALGDTLRLTITATEDEELDEVDLRALLDDFEILQRSTSSNTSIVNGRLSHIRQVLIDLTPNRQGKLHIPPLHIGQATTQTLSVVVDATPDAPNGDQPVVFEAEVNQQDVYVQGQIILTLRVQQSVNMDGRSISELKLDNAFVKPLEQQSFQRTIDGRQWLVDELRYAIFPEQSGTLEIPAQVFSGRIKQRQRSFFDIGGSGQLVRRSTAALSINVLPKPDSFTADTWLPAQHLTLQENWSTPPEQLRVGESTTRTIRIQGEGLQGAQLPPVLFVPIDGLKYYPDQPQISEQETSSGLLGLRQDSAAVVPTRAGTYMIPEIRIPWWDTRTEQVRYAVLPERHITVTAAESGNTPDTPATADSDAPAAAAPTTPVTAATAQSVPNLIWPILAAVSTLGWLVTLLYLWRRRHPGVQAAGAPPDNSTEKQAFKRLLATCAAGDAASARSAVIAWANVVDTDRVLVALEQVATHFDDEELTRELDHLDTRLYSPVQDKWNGDQLAACARRLRSGHHHVTENTKAQLTLYPKVT